jgi:hypothetical protein
MSQTPWESFTSTVGSVWLAVGPLIGVCIGAYLTKRWQRSQWIADHKRAEYRKLLTTLAGTFIGSVRLRGSGVALGAREQRRLYDLEARASVVILDRIFIADEVKEMNLLKRWNQAFREYDNTLNHDNFAKAFGLISRDIRKAAAELIKEKNWLEWLDESTYCATMREMQAPKK